MVALYNHSQETHIINDGDRIAQMLIIPCALAKFILSDDLTETERNDKGFGSSGTN